MIPTWFQAMIWPRVSELEKPMYMWDRKTLEFVVRCTAVAQVTQKWCEFPSKAPKKGFPSEPFLKKALSR